MVDHKETQAAAIAGWALFIILLIVIIILAATGNITSNSNGSPGSGSGSNGNGASACPPNEVYYAPSVQQVAVAAPPSGPSCSAYLRSGGSITVTNNGFTQTITSDPACNAGLSSNINTSSRNGKNYNVGVTSTSEGFQTAWSTVSSDGVSYAVYINEDGSVTRTRGGVIYDYLPSN